jgi:2',3'-cyclic-nucleotide 2'-phosphodiesterase (5'-nucleotidase family)
VLVYAKERDYYQTLIAENQIDFALRMLPITENTLDQHQSSKVYSIGNSTPFMLLRMSWQSNSHDKNLIIETPQIYYSYPPTKPTTSLLVDEYHRRLNRLLNQNIGFFGSEIQTTRSLVRTMEMPFGNFIADALKHYAKTDIGLINGGVIRGNKTYSNGTIITRGDIATELPFRTYVAVLSVTGEQLKQALENSVSEVEFVKGRFLQVSGVSFTYSLEKSPGERIQSIFINGSPLDPKQKYSVATTDYLANGGDGYKQFLNALRQEQRAQKPPLLADVVIHEIQQQHTISPKVEFRIKRVME